MDSELIANFCSITDATDSTAEYYLSAAGGDLDMAIGLFYESGGTSTTGGNQNVRETSSERAAEISSTTAAIAPIVISESEGESEGEVVLSRPPQATSVTFDNYSSSQSQSEPEDAIFNTSSNTAHSRRLADLFRPPHGIMFNGTFEMARRHAREQGRWLLITVHAPTDFASQAMNRDLWNSALLQSFIRENFVFVQLIVGGTDEKRYASFYPYDGLYPHVALIDPRTGERVETLLVSSIPVPGFKLVPKEQDMLELLGEFIAEHPMDAIGEQRKRSTSGENSEREAKKSFVDAVSTESVQIESESNKKAESEPDVNSTVPAVPVNYEGPDAILIQFRLPNGQKHRQKFSPAAKISEIFETAAAVSQTPLGQFKLRTGEGELGEDSVVVASLHNTMLTIIK